MSATDAFLRNQDFYRFVQVVESPGDIYEIEQSACAIAIGPNSDISAVLIQYYDADAPDQIGSVVVSQGAPFFGKIDVNMITPVSSTGELGRILVSPLDVTTPSYVRPTPSVAPPSRRSVVPTVLELLIFSKMPPMLPDQRADKVLVFPSVPYEYINGNPDGSTDLVIPAFGRRMFSFSAVSALQYRLRFYAGTFLASGVSPAPLLLGSIEQLVTSTANQTKSVVYRASDQWDGQLQTPSAQTTVNQPLGAVKGQVSYLVINVSNPANTPGFRLLEQLTVRLSDKES